MAISAKARQTSSLALQPLRIQVSNGEKLASAVGYSVGRVSTWMICWSPGSRLKTLPHASASRASAAAPDNLVMGDRLEFVPLLPQPNPDRRSLVPQRANPRQRILQPPHQLIVSRNGLVKQFPPPRQRHRPVLQLEVHAVEHVNIPRAQHRLHLIERETK